MDSSRGERLEVDSSSPFTGAYNSVGLQTVRLQEELRI